MQWKRGDRVKVSPAAQGSLKGRLGTVHRVPKGNRVEVEMDSMHLTSTGIVAFHPDDLIETIKNKPTKVRLGGRG